MAEQAIFNGNYSVEELEGSISMFCQYKKLYNQDVVNGYTGNFIDWLAYITQRTLTLQQSEWDALEADTAKMTAFCNKYNGWTVDVTENATVTTWHFGDKFPIRFS